MHGYTTMSDGEDWRLEDITVGGLHTRCGLGGLLLAKAGHGIFNLRNDLSACCARIIIIIID